MVQYNPKSIMGKWRKGYALDVHTLSSECIGYNESGHPIFENQYSELGNVLYRLKSKQDTSVIPEIVVAVERFMKAAKSPIDVLIPVPPSNESRTVQPVILLAQAISKAIGIPLLDCIQKTRKETELKNIYDRDERVKRLEGLHIVDKSQVLGKRVLLFDDLYRSGATMNAIATELYDKGAADVLALTITKTRSNQ
jgi:predicted amidophosphoribosyltransferase